MREIKFRAWHKDERRWINLNGFDIFFNGCILEGMVDLIYEQGNLKPYPLKVCELVQYTGLKDQNGKEIYEGDIIKDDWRNSPRVVIFTDACFMSDYKNGKSQEFIDFEVSEVIGNIYENPELLES